MKTRAVLVVCLWSAAPLVVATALLTVSLALVPLLVSHLVPPDENPFAVVEYVKVREQAATAPGLELLSGSSRYAFITYLAPFLPDRGTQLSTSQQVIGLVTAFLRFLEKPGDSPMAHVLVVTIRVGLVGFVSLAALCFLLLGTVLLRRQTVRKRLAWSPAHRFMVLGAAAGVGCVTFAYLLDAVLRLMRLSLPERPVLGAILGDPSSALLAAVSLVLLAPFAEELFFRGYVFRYLLQEAPRWVAYGVTSLLFAGAHLYPAGLALYILYGLVFAWLTERTGSIVPAFAAHALINGAAIVANLLN